MGVVKTGSPTQLDRIEAMLKKLLEGGKKW